MTDTPLMAAARTVLDSIGWLSVDQQGKILIRSDQVAVGPMDALEMLGTALAAEEQRQEAVANELNGYKMTVDEGSEIHGEFVVAFAGLANEKLEPCGKSCPGHLGPRATTLFRRGLRRYRIIHPWPAEVEKAE